MLHSPSNHGQTCEKEVLSDVDQIGETSGSDIWEHWSNGIGVSVDRIILRRYEPPTGKIITNSFNQLKFANTSFFLGQNQINLVLGTVQCTTFSILVDVVADSRRRRASLVSGKNFATSPTLPHLPSFHIIIHQLNCHKVITTDSIYRGRNIH